MSSVCAGGKHSSTVVGVALPVPLVQVRKRRLGRWFGAELAMELGTHPSHSPVAGLSKALRQVEKCD